MTTTQAVPDTSRPPGALDLPSPYLLFLGDVKEPGYAKTAFGVRDWAPDRCVGEMSSEPDSVTAGLPKLTPAEARSRGARSVLIGVANVGGELKASWIDPLVGALEAGLDIVSGLHMRLADTQEIRQAAERLGRRLYDVRIPPSPIPVATGRRRSGKRLLTVGTDCALGKKYTALAITRELEARGVACDFRATGQTGIIIAGSGMPMDAVVADFAAGAAELLSPDAPPDHWDVIEGQGSLFHPSYAGVSLALLHGSQPDVIVVCHEPGRQNIVGTAGYGLPGLAETIDLNLRLGSRTNPRIRCGGISLNTSQFRDAEALQLMAEESRKLGLPVADPMRGGAMFERLVDACVRAPG
jgi:uncharacterized NAD-dependent epimerase/dehydratase family protein